jgi:nitroreductase
METIYKRRSIRKYTGEPVSEEALLKFIKAGMNAPSAGNEQPWYFVIINERETLNAIADVHPYAKMLYQAPAAILVCGNPSLEKHEGYWVQDCSAATQNILLEIEDQEYGGVWIGVYPREERINSLRDLLEVPENIIPFSLIGLGHPAEFKDPNDKFPEERIRWNRWS